LPVTSFPGKPVSGNRHLKHHEAGQALQPATCNSSLKPEKQHLKDNMVIWPAFCKLEINKKCCHMIKISDLKFGDMVVAEYEGQQREGMVKDVDRPEGKALVEAGGNEYWYEPGELYPIALNDEQMHKLGFTKQAEGDGRVKYMKDSFRVLLPKKDDFSSLEIWWREDHRYLNQTISVHELQNHYYQMTKVELMPVAVH
jgi:hypothetical protein